jgi:hypothetical protein
MEGLRSASSSRGVSGRVRAHGSPLCQDMAEVGDLRADPAGAVPTGGDMISNPNLVGAATPPLPFHGSAPRKATGPPLRSPGSLPRSLRDGPGAALDPGASMAPASTQCGQARPAPPRAALPVSTPRRTRSSKFKPPWFEGIARLAWLVADPGSGLSEGPVFGVRPVALVCRVVPCALPGLPLCVVVGR